MSRRSTRSQPSTPVSDVSSEGAPGRAAGVPLKSATRPRSSYETAPARTTDQRGPALPRAVTSPADARQAQLEFFLDHLAVTPNKRGKPYSPMTIGPYRDAVISLGKYLTKVSFEGGYEDVTVAVLNGYLADYRANNSQGGVVTKQGNLRVFFAWLVEEYQAPEVYTDRKRHRYAREDDPAPLLSDEFLDDLLRITGGRSFNDVRDHAIIRVFLTGARRAEVTALHVDDLDLRSAIKTAATRRIKGRPGRLLPLAPETVVAINRWLRTRAAARSRPAPNEGPLWIADRGGRALNESGIYQMLRRRAVQAGYDPHSVHPHLFRHTTAHQFLLDGGSEGDLMQLMGWKDSEMAHRYGRSAAQERALLYAARTGFGSRKA